MDEMNAIERQLARVARQKVGPLPPADIDHVVRRAVRSRWPTLAEGVRRLASLGTAAVVVTLFGGFLLAALLTDGIHDDVPALAPTPSADASPTAATQAVTQQLVVAADGSGDYATIPDAIAAAGDGDSIVVRPGTYDGAVIIDKDVSIVGEGPRDAVVVRIVHHPGGESPWIGWESPTPFAFWIQGRAPSSVSIANLTVSAGGLPACPESESREACAFAVLVEQGSLNLERVTTAFGDHPGSALYSVAGARITASDSVLDRAVDFSNELSDAASLSISPLTIRDSELTGPIRADFVELRDNVITWTEPPWDVADGGLVTIGRQGVIEANEIDSRGLPNFPAVWVDEAANVVVRSNTIKAERTGIRYHSFSRGLIESNSIDVAGVGIWLDGADVEVLRNKVRGAATGIEVRAGSPYLADNVVTEGAVGLRAQGPDAQPGLLCNDFSANDTDIVVGSGARIDDQAAEGFEEDPCAEP